jgi:hypothetical protein
MLRDSSGIQRLPDVRPGVPALRGPVDQGSWYAAHCSLRVPGQAPIRSGRLDGNGARGKGFAGAGKGPGTLYWPGIRHGVRGPTPDETPLSWEEVQLGLALGALQ